MKNNNYSVLGKILAILNNDFPPYVSKTFSDNVMKNIHMNIDSKNFNYKNFINIAASVFFAVITAYGLTSFQQTENNIAAQNFSGVKVISTAQYFHTQNPLVV